MHPFVTRKGYFTTAILKIQDTEYRKSYGHSNFVNTSKYVLQALKKDIKLIEETGELRGIHYMWSDEEMAELDRFRE